MTKRTLFVVLVLIAVAGALFRPSALKAQAKETRDPTAGYAGAWMDVPVEAEPRRPRSTASGRKIEAHMEVPTPIVTDGFASGGEAGE